MTTMHNSSVYVYVVALAVLIAFALTIAPEEPEWIEYHHHQTTTTSTITTENNNAVRFVGGDGKTMLTGHWYYLPPQDQNTSTNSIAQRQPVILLAQGMGLVQSNGLTPFVNAFQSAGFAVFTFDYATFGESDGLPRHQIQPENHVADIKAAIAMIKKEQASKDSIINATNIGLWGTSLGGGHVLKVASENHNDPSIRAVVSQIPHLASGFESVVLGSLSRTPMVALQGLGMFKLGLVKWALFRIMGKTAYYPIVGQPGSAAMMQDPGDEEGYLGLLAPPPKNDNGWKNAATTVSGLSIVFAYRPLSVVASIATPVLLVAAEKDTLCPANYVQQAKQLIKGAEFLMVPNAGHFDVYKGKELQAILAAQVDFFKKHLLSS